MPKSPCDHSNESEDQKGNITCAHCGVLLREGGAVPLDVRRLVIAARRAFDLGYSDAEFQELDKALEEFAARVPYDPE